MTKKSLQNWFIAMIIFFIMLIGLGILFSVLDSDLSSKRYLYSTFKDLLPIAIAIPVSWLGYCLQRRISYLQSIRSVWSKLIDAIQTANQYTFLKNPSHTEYFTMLTKLSIVIDEVRALFKNIQENEIGKGLYPFEPLKTIYKLMSDLKFDDEFKEEKAVKVRKDILRLWRLFRDEILKEFDRETPTFSVSLFEFDEKKYLRENT
jgi:hypothetical protein